MKRVVVLVVSIALLGLAIAWRINTTLLARAEQEKGAARRKSAPPRVSVAAAQRRDIVRRIEEVGLVEPRMRVEIEPKVAGRVADLTLREGDPVRAGQVVATIRSAELDAQILEQESRLAEARARLAQATLGTAPNDVAIAAQIRRDQAALRGADASLVQAQRAADAQVASARAAVADRQARVDAAQVAILNARAQLLAAQSSLANAHARHARLQSLLAKGFVSAQDVDNARTQAEVQEGAVEVARGQVNAAEEGRKSAVALLRAAEKEVEATEARGRAEVEVARAAAGQSAASLDLARANTAQKPAYRANLDALRAAVAAAQAQLRNIRALKATTVLRSPVDGFLTQRFLDPGALCTSAQPIAVVEALDAVFVVVRLPEEVGPDVRPGDPAQVRVDALGGRSLPGVVAQVNVAADPRTHQFLVRVRVANADGLLKSGMFARVGLEVARTPGAVVVPPEAVRPDKDGEVVAVVGDDAVAHLRPVRTGARDARGVAVLSGIAPGERVVTLSMMPVRDGQKVAVAAPDGDEAPKVAPEGQKRTAGARP